MSFALVQVSPFSVLNFFLGGLPPDPVLWPDGAVTHATVVGFARGNWMFCNTTATPAQPGPLFTLGSSTPFLAGSTVTYTQVWTPPSLATVQSAFLQQIHSGAEARLQLISAIIGGGQAVVHQRKITEAMTLANDPSPNSVNYPMLSALVGVQGSTLGAVGTAILNAVGVWVPAAAQIEAARVGGVLAVSAATTLLGAASAFNAITWPTQSGTGTLS